MKEMIKKVREDRKGFTLMELLIVVAIIAVLVAIMIPVFGSSLEKAKEAADVANLRSAYAEAQVAMIDDSDLSASEAWTEAYGHVSNAINYSDKITAQPSDTSGDITYSANKLTAPDGGKVFTWSLTGNDLGD